MIDYAYDVPSIAADLDWISVMTYDYHGHWDKKTGHVAPMYHHPDYEFDYFNTVNTRFIKYFFGSLLISHCLPESNVTPAMQLFQFRYEAFDAQ